MPVWSLSRNPSAAYHEWAKGSLLFGTDIILGPGLGQSQHADTCHVCIVYTSHSALMSSTPFEPPNCSGSSLRQRGIKELKHHFKKSLTVNVSGSGHLTPEQGLYPLSPVGSQLILHGYKTMAPPADKVINLLSTTQDLHEEAMRAWIWEHWYYSYGDCPPHMYTHLLILLSYKHGNSQLECQDTVMSWWVAELANNLLICDMLHLVNYLYNLNDSQNNILH